MATAREPVQIGAARWITGDTTRLRQVLTHPVVEERLLAPDLRTARPIRAVDGSDLRLRSLGARARVGEVAVIRANTVAKNSGIRAIGRAVNEPLPMARRREEPPSSSPARSRAP